MARQIVARQQGDDYQARWFWLQACGVLDEFSDIHRVVYEDPQVRSFDDVAVYYRSGYADEKGRPLDVLFYQVKFHVTSAGSLTAESLCDPNFIGARRYSLLQRIKNADDYCRVNGINHRLAIYTPWSIHPDDELGEVHSLSDGSFRLDTLSMGGDRSRRGKLRRRWREHIGLRSDDELRDVLARVRIYQGPTLDELARNLNWRLEAKGLKPVGENRLLNPYDELTRKMLQAGSNELTAESLLEICGREGLLVRVQAPPANVTVLGIRSFLRWAEDLENQTQSMVCLSRFFAGRRIENPEDWNTEIPSLIARFVQERFVRGGSYRLHLDTHSSVAFLAGYLLPEKMGINVEVVQHSGRGASLWSYVRGQGAVSGSWQFVDEPCDQGATESALAIGLTHNIRDDVVRYVRECIPSVGHVVLALPSDGSSSSAVRDGAHAEELANQLSQYLRSKGIGLKAENRVHIFSAAPNGFVFCFGRKMLSFPYWTLYEYDFGSGTVGAYSPSIINSSRG